MLHTLRQIVNDDEKFRSILRGLSAKFYHQTVTTAQVEGYLAKATGLDLTSFFDQYLRNTKIPAFESIVEGKTLNYRWSQCISGFKMPLKIQVNETEKWVSPAADWKNLDVPENAVITVDPAFYVTQSPHAHSEANSESGRK